MNLGPLDCKSTMHPDCSTTLPQIFIVIQSFFLPFFIAFNVHLLSVRPRFFLNISSVYFSELLEHQFAKDRQKKDNHNMSKCPI